MRFSTPQPKLVVVGRVTDRRLATIDCKAEGKRDRTAWRITLDILEWSVDRETTVGPLHGNVFELRAAVEAPEIGVFVRLTCTTTSGRSAEEMVCIEPQPSSGPDGAAVNSAARMSRLTRPEVSRTQRR